ncbi:PhoD-like phosphatase [Saccharothrix australiensis]|uniref:PhoD-like phosphatase n=1 Tax=Saccharothrix australiensis TaxID=2072 RepID=A0A495VUK5_9PSEU|nr:PhoD-like phosphatase [Saccharothrix australiensis]
MTEGVVNRRTLLRAGAIGTVAAFAPGVAQAASGRPVLTHGVQSGDVTFDGGLVWTRSDRPARMLVEVASDPSFRHARGLRGPLLTPSTGGTGRTASCTAATRCTPTIPCRRRSRCPTGGSGATW